MSKEESDKNLQSGPEPKAEAVEGKDQIKALVTLLPVAGVLWALFHFGPKAGDWITGQIDQVLPQSEESSVAPGSATDSAADSDSESEATTDNPIKINPVRSVSGYREQIVEQLGASREAEVRHLAVSEDGQQLVAALQMVDESGEAEMSEVFFQRDQFGRFVSFKGLPDEVVITLWPKTNLE